METGEQFDTCATAYAQYRLHYPDDLFSWLSTCTPQHQLAWDVGTGNGQAAIPLAKYFEQILATDSGKQQLNLAPQLFNVRYQCVAAEDATIATASVDLITVACAVHWFDLARFYQKCYEVLKPTGISALGLKEITQSILIKKLCTYTTDNRTPKAILEYDKLICSIYTLRYLQDRKLQRDVHRSQNRVESYHQLRAAIATAYGKKQLIGSGSCGRTPKSA